MNQDRLASPVPGHLGLGPVRVEDPQPRQVTGLLRLGQQQDPVGRDSGVAGADRTDPSRRELERERVRLNDHIVIP